MQFGLTEEQEKKLSIWVTEIRDKAIEKQKQEIKETNEFYSTYKQCWELGFPYSGTIGGSLTYSFSPTSIGDVVVVKDSHTGEEIDLTEYDMW